MVRVGTAVLLASLLAFSLYAEEPDCAKRKIPVGILDSHGDVPQSLGVGAFTAEIDHKLLEITAAGLDSGRKRVAILVDISESMGKSVYYRGKANLAYWVVADAIKRLPKEISIAVLAFNVHVDRELDFSVSREQLASEIAEREKSPESLMRGKTALRDAIEYVLNHIPNVGPGDAIYVITDGEDNRSQIGTSQLENRLEAAGVRLDVFLLQDFAPTGDPLPGSDETIMLARETGGTVIEIHPAIHGTGTSGTTENFAVSPERQRIVSGELTLLYRQTATPYMLEVKVPTVLNKVHRWKLSMADQERQKSTHLFYARRILPCQSP